MKNLKTKDTGMGIEEEPTRGQSIIAAAIFLSPLIFYGMVSLLGDYYKAHSKVSSKPTAKYTYEARKPDIVYKESYPQSIDMPYSNPQGVTLYLDNIAIQTDLSSEEILQQLSLDYQDIYDYYGGSEELY